MALAAFEAVTPLPLAAQMLSRTRHAAQRLFEIVETDPTVKDTPQPLPKPKLSRLAVQDLSFAYHSQDMAALNEISFTVPEGESLAIVGSSGVGKSSLVNLLLRYWEYNQGTIKLRENELKP